MDKMVWMCKKNEQNEDIEKGITIKIYRKEICGTFQIKVLEDIQE